MTPFKILSQPSKMPCASFSLPAGDACPFAVYGEGSICDTCYADKGFYLFSKRTQTPRFQWVKQSLRTQAGTLQLIADLIAAVEASFGPKHKGQKYFRIHDSGDFFNPKYVRVWMAVAQALPQVRFWAPTRAWRNPKMLQALRDLASLPNVTIRPSALYIGDDAPIIDGLAAGSTVDGPAQACVAPSQDNKCGECRVCWDAPTTAVSYKLH